MKYIALFENWKEEFLTRYGKALKLTELGLLPSPMAPGSQVWEDFKQIVADRLEDNGFDIEENFTVNENRATLEISYTQELENGPIDTKYLRFMIMWKEGEPDIVYLIGPSYLKEISVKRPLFIVEEILRIAEDYLKLNRKPSF